MDFRGGVDVGRYENLVAMKYKKNVQWSGRLVTLNVLCKGCGFCDIAAVKLELFPDDELTQAENDYYWDEIYIFIQFWLKYRRFKTEPLT